MKKLLFLILLISFAFCTKTEKVIPHKVETTDQAKPPSLLDSSIYYVVDAPVLMENYYSFLDSVLNHYKSKLPYELNEHILVWSNTWIIDSLAQTDYYLKIKKSEFVYDHKKLVIFSKGDSLLIPNQDQVISIQNNLGANNIDINIPEFKLRILEENKVVKTFPIRVGRNETRFLETAGRPVDLRTQTGEGKILEVKKDPIWMNPVDGHRYTHTNRDDKRRTKVPMLPWLITEINGTKTGQLIHPTTNPETLGKAYSNGCIGTRESDIWYIYYYAPVGTPLVIRYDLSIVDSTGKNIILKDIYKDKRHYDNPSCDTTFSQCSVYLHSISL